MRIDGLRVEASGGWQSLCATVHWETANRPSQDIHFRVRGEGVGLTRQVNPFVLAALVPAMAAGEERMSLEDPVDPVLAQGLPSAAAILALWCRDIAGGWREPRLEAPIEALEGSGPRQTASFFSGGVDATFTLLRNRALVPRGGRGSIRHALMVYGLDLGFRDPDGERTAFDEFVERSGPFLESVGVSPVIIETNLRALDPRPGFWGRAFVGAALSGLAQLFPERIEEVLIGTDGEPLGESVQMPWGSHPVLHSYMCSSAVQSRSPFVEVPRLARVREIAASDPALDQLRVCFASRGGRANCGECEKCVRTRIALMVVGADSQRGFAGRPLTPALLESISISSVVGQRNHEALRQALRSQGRSEWVSAEDRLLARWYRYERWRQGRGFRGWLKHQDQRWLGGALARLRGGGR